MTGKSLAHFVSIFLVGSLWEGANFGTGWFCEMEFSNGQDISSEKINQFQNWSHSPRGGGAQKIREKMCKTFARHCNICLFCPHGVLNHGHFYPKTGLKWAICARPVAYDNYYSRSKIAIIISLILTFTIKVAELWTVVHENYSLLAPSHITGWIIFAIFDWE